MTNTFEWRSLGRADVASQVRGEILRMVTECHLEPGSRLPAEREMAAELGVSRPSIREAIRTLQAEGRVEVRHGTGVFITQPPTNQLLRGNLSGIDDIKMLFDMREILEVAAARWAAERQLPELAAVHVAYDQLESAASAPASDVDPDEIQRLDMIFHTRIVQASGNALLEHTQSMIYEYMLAGIQTTLLIPGRMDKSREDHARILSAIQNGECDAAANAAASHIQGARCAALSHAETLYRNSTDK